MAGMDEVGRLFNTNELIVAEVLQSAEAMKAAVNHLEQFMEKAETSTRGKVVLATVKGDVHDIGKNLVEIILSNNGYHVINLGIKVPPDALIRGYPRAQPGRHRAVRPAREERAADGPHRRAISSAAGIDIPLLVGGAALSKNFINRQIAPAYAAPTFYAKDAMTGLRLMNEIMDPATREEALRSNVHLDQPADDAVAGAGRRRCRARSGATGFASTCRFRQLPYPDRRARLVPDLAEVWSYINPFMLYGRHSGFKGKFEQLLAERDPKALALHDHVEEVKRLAAGFMKVRAVWQFFEAERDGNTIHLFEAEQREPVHTFAFGRQPTQNGLCLSDYILPARRSRRDSHRAVRRHGGRGRSCNARRTRRRPAEFFKAHALQALAIETAEGCRGMAAPPHPGGLGLSRSAEMTMQERFTSRYRGKRYSFGYPACPNLDDQQGIWKLLRPEEIGVQLTEGMMMEPEASVSALVFHHPDCAYFTAAVA